jgi:hypothetical protein
MLHEKSATSVSSCVADCNLEPRSMRALWEKAHRAPRPHRNRGRIEIRRGVIERQRCRIAIKSAATFTALRSDAHDCICACCSCLAER